MGSTRLIEPLEPRRLLAATLVKDLVPGAGSSNPSTLTAVGDKLYFFASLDTTIQQTLYASDGTAAGTIPLQNYAGSAPAKIVDLNGRLIFSQDSTLYEFDPATNKSVILTNSGGGVFENFVTVGNDLYFGTYTNTGSYTPDATNDAFWKSDGTTAGTVKLADGVNPGEITAVGSKIFFINNDPNQLHDNSDLWISDGTPAGTSRFFRQYTSNIVALGNRLLFSVSNAVDGTSDAGLWITDGTIAGTQRLLPQDANSNGLADIQEMCVIGSQVYFADALGQLWRTDGTTAGTVLIKMFEHVVGTSIANRLATGAVDLFNFNGTLVFGGDPIANGNSIPNDNVEHHELWRSDGTPDGTYALSAINTKPWTGDYIDPYPYNFTVAGNTLFFWAAVAGAPGVEVFATDGNSVIHVAAFPEIPVAAGSQLYFDNSTRSRGAELWKSTVADIPGNLAGAVFSDADDNNVQASGESGARGRVVYLDANNNAHLDAGELSTTTTSTGRFQFNELPPGKYRVRVVPAAGQIAESAPRLPVTSFATKTIHIGVVPSASIHGVVFNDANHNGVFDASETGIASARLYLDANGNHAFDSGERNTRSDSDGKFEFDDLLPGTYALRASAILNWTWTTPIARTITLAVGGSVSRNFGGYFA